MGVGRCSLLAGKLLAQSSARTVGALGSAMVAGGYAWLAWSAQRLPWPALAGAGGSGVVGGAWGGADDGWRGPARAGRLPLGALVPRARAADAVHRHLRRHAVAVRPCQP